MNVRARTHTQRQIYTFVLKDFSSTLGKKGRKGKIFYYITTWNFLHYLPSRNGNCAAHWARLLNLGCHIFFKKVYNSKSQIAQILFCYGAGTLHSHWFICLQQVLTSADGCLATGKLSSDFMLSTGCVPWPMKEPRFLQDPYWEAVRIHYSSLPVLTDRLSFPLFKPRYRDTEEGEGQRIACLGSHFRYKLRYNLGDSNEMTQEMLGMIGNWMGLNYTASLPTSLVWFCVTF